MVCHFILLQLYIYIILYFRYIVDTGHKGFKFNKVTGLQPTIFREGYHLRIPWFEIPIVYNVKSQPKNFESKAGSKGKIIMYFG